MIENDQCGVQERIHRLDRVRVGVNVMGQKGHRGSSPEASRTKSPSQSLLGVPRTSPACPRGQSLLSQDSGHRGAIRAPDVHTGNDLLTGPWH